MTDIVQHLPEVAGGGTLLVIGYGFKMLTEWIQTMRSGALEKKKLEIHEESIQVTDAAAANAIILSSMQALQNENQRLGAKVDKLDAQNSDKDARIAKLQDEVSELRIQVRSLLAKIDNVDFELGDLRDN
jgi:peptidoglycan hydrolase CwlO-like protein